MAGQPQPQPQPLPLVRGQDTKVAFTPPAPVDITGQAVELFVSTFTAADGAFLLVVTTAGGGVVITPVSGVIVATLPGLSIGALQPGRYNWELWRTDSGARTRRAFGTAIVADSKVQES